MDLSEETGVGISGHRIGQGRTIVVSADVAHVAPTQEGHSGRPAHRRIAVGILKTHAGVCQPLKIGRFDGEVRIVRIRQCAELFRHDDEDVGLRYVHDMPFRFCSLIRGSLVSNAPLPLRWSVGDCRQSHAACLAPAVLLHYLRNSSTTGTATSGFCAGSWRIRAWSVSIGDVYRRIPSGFSHSNCISDPS